MATNNPGKLEEMQSLLADMVDWRLISPQLIGLHLSVEEDGISYQENAALKARAFSKASGFLALADDSGLEVEALLGAPGLYSARYSTKKDATAADRRQFLLKQLAPHPRPWPARFVSTICLAESDGSLHFAEGFCQGEIILQARGYEGFGYDPIFFLKDKGKTMAQLTMEEKNQLSHRGHAMKAIKTWLNEMD